MIDIKSRILTRRKLRVVFKGTPQKWNMPTRYDQIRKHVCITESQPVIHTIAIALRKKIELEDGELEDRYETTIHRKTLAFPYMQYYLYQDDDGDNETLVYVTWTKQPLQTKKDYVGIPLLPNIYTNAAVCMDDEWTHSKWPDKTRLANDVICKSFWKTIFTPNEAQWPYKIRLPESELVSFDRWEEMTNEKNTPDFMLALDCITSYAKPFYKLLDNV